MTEKPSDKYRLVDLVTGKDYPLVSTIQAAIDRQAVDKLDYWEVWHQGAVVRSWRTFSF